MDKVLTTAPGKVSLLMDQLNESATLAMARLSRELQQQGEDIISLSLGEPDFDTPEFIKDAARQALDNNITHYPPVNGILEVRQAIARKLLRDNGLKYSADQIVVSTGAKQAIANAIYALVNPGDEVIMPSPFWVSYAELVKLVGGKSVLIGATVDSNYKITPQQLQNAITPKTKLIIYSSPCNPTGSVYSKEELEAFAAVIEQYENVYVISDEIYELINFTGRTASIAACGNMIERTITVNGVSKAFAMTGWRIGYAAAPKWIADACNKMQGQITSGANSIAQMAAGAAMDADPAITVSPMIKVFKQRRDLVYALLMEIPGLKINLPEGAFYFFPDVSFYFGKTDGDTVINNATDLANYMLRKDFVAVVTGDAFGDHNCIRISYAASETVLKEALSRIKKSLTRLK